jgi:putative transcriptional regulator
MATLLGAAALFAAIASGAEDTGPPADPPAGQLLIASAEIQDPRFQHSVILLLRHDRTGAFGIAINRPLGERALAAVLAEADRKSQKPGEDGAIEGTIRLFVGGPVQPRFGFVVHSTDYRRPETLAVAGGVAVTASTDVLRDIGHHQGPAKYLFALGYCGWGAGQLEAEIAHRDWFTAPADPALVLDADRDAVWQTALARRTQEL